jgi:hypothetical protein
LIVSVGAIDATVVSNVTLIEWNEVIPFEPVGSGIAASSYLAWAIPISTITVSASARPFPDQAHAVVRRLGHRPSNSSPHILKQMAIALWRYLICKAFHCLLFFVLRVLGRRGTDGIFGPYQDVSFVHYSVCASLKESLSG